METINLFDDLEIIGVKPSEISSSKKMFGIVTVNEFDEDHKLVSSETSHNEIVLPGSLYSLEKMFNVENVYHDKFIHPANITLDGKTYTINDYSLNTKPADLIEKLKIFGFVIGNGGDSETGVIASKYAINKLSDVSGACTEIPFVVTSTPGNYRTKYAMESSLAGDTNSYFFAKLFDKVDNKDAVISIFDTNGVEITSMSAAETSQTSVIIRAEMKLTISPTDIRSFYGTDLSNALISQIGIVAGYPATVQGQSYTAYYYPQLITSYNFKEKDFSNNKNSLEMTYRIYSV